MCSLYRYVFLFMYQIINSGSGWNITSVAGGHVGHTDAAVHSDYIRIDSILQQIGNLNEKSIPVYQGLYLNINRPLTSLLSFFVLIVIHFPISCLYGLWHKVKKNQCRENWQLLCLLWYRHCWNVLPACLLHHTKTATTLD